jgi:chromosome partitioning protein
MKGGVGKTTMSVNISDCLARRHNARVLLIDIDPQFNATQCLMSGDEYIKHLQDEKDTILTIFERQNRTTVSTVNGISQSSSKSLEDIENIRIKDNFDLLPGNLELYRVEMTPGEGRENRLNKYIRELERQNLYDYVLIDTPPTPSVWMTSALLASNYYLIPVKPDPISFTGIDLLQSIIQNKKENFDLQIECAGIVLTMIEESTLVYREALQQLEKGKWKDYKFNKALPKRTVIARTQTNKGFILDLQDDVSKISLSGIVNELIKRVQ